VAKHRRGRLKPRSPEVVSGGLPFVAIVGRPNVGKSTLFNRLIGQRIAITEPTAGTTRDRVAALLSLEDGRRVELCDMGGAGGTGDPHDRDVNAQIDLAMDYADVVLFVVDGRDGLTPLDERLGRRLLKLGKPVLLVVNKTESPAAEMAANEFYALGLDAEPLCVSAQEGEGKSDLLEAIARALPEEEAAAPAEAAAANAPERVLRLAIVGRRNVGKSTYVNRLFGSERVIASAQAGTTRDAVDVRVEVGGRPVVLIDTAGLRKRGKADDHIEIISHGRAVEAIRRSDAALLLLDCADEVSQVDKKIAQTVAEEHKACVIVANKWDLTAERMTLEDYSDYVAGVLPGIAYAPIVGISALEGTHATAPVELAFELHGQSLERVATGPLNRVLAAAIERRRPKARRGKLGKVYFCTQVATNPVTLLLFVNEPELFDRAYRRYLVGQLRQGTPWEEVPIKLVFRPRQSLTRRSGAVARRVKALPGLAEESRWVERGGPDRVQALADALDGDEVREALEAELAAGEAAEAGEPAPDEGAAR